MLVYGLAELPMAMAAFSMALFIPVFYARDLGLSLSVVAAVLVAARWTDLITDPIVGFLSDRIRTQWGRRKPWILAGAPIMLLAIIQLFTPRGEMTAARLALWTAVLWLGWTMVAIPYHAWGAELSCNYHQRTRIATWRTLFSVAGSLTAIAAPLISGKLFGYGWNLDEALTIIAVMTVTIGGIAFTWLLSRVSETAPLEVRRVAALEGLRLMWQNGPFKRLMVAFVLAALGPAMAAPVFFFYLDHVIVADIAVTTPLLVFYFGNLLGVAAWGYLAERIGKRPAWMAAMWLMVLSQPGFLFLGPGDVIPMLVILFVGGASAGSLVGLPYAMKADVIDLDRLASGADRTGLFFSSWSLAQKSVTSLALAFSLLILAVADFEPAGINGHSQIWALKLSFAGIPTLCYAAALLVIRSYPLTEERHRLVMRQLAARVT
jgi:glycoside/pentoside/hexuronide:cation symporter, GPH family